MQIPIYHLRAFADQIHAGNPAAVCVLPSWLPPLQMQLIAAENNLSETTFMVAENDSFALRWFTPTEEINLCGHGTLAAAYIVFNKLKLDAQQVQFSSASGALTVYRHADHLTLDFPVRLPQPCEAPKPLIIGLGLTPKETYRATAYLAVFESEKQISDLSPDMQQLAQLDCRSVIVTAPSNDADIDFVSRYFVPRAKNTEDPVTGSAHCTLTPYWATRLNKTKLHAKQISSRGGELWCELKVDRVWISGKVLLYLEGNLQLAD